MKEIKQGWVIVNKRHPYSKKSVFCGYTFSELRKDAIDKFVAGSGQSWKYWRDQFYFKAVRANSTIKLNAKL